MSTPLTREFLREELGRFYDVSLKPEFAALAEKLVEKRIEALSSIGRSVHRSDAAISKLVTPGVHEGFSHSSSMLSLPNRSSMLSELPRRNSKLRYLKDGSSGTDSFGLPIFSPSSSFGKAASAECSWMTRHRMSYSVGEEKLHVKMPRSVDAVLFSRSASDGLSSQSNNEGSTWLGGVGARLWQQRHNESYRRLHLVKDRLIQASAAQPDTYFDIEGDASETHQEPPSPHGSETNRADSGDQFENQVMTRSNTKKITRTTCNPPMEPTNDFIIANPTRASSATRASLARDENPLFKDRVSNVLHGQGFACVVTFLVIANAAILGLETDYMARNWTHEVPNGFLLAEKVICACFVAEILLRMYVFHFDFFTANEWFNNVLDLLVTCLQVADLFDIYDRIVGVEPRHVKGEKRLEVPVWRTLLLVRFTRLVRLVRVATLLHVLAELRTLLISINDSMKSVFWVLVLLILMMYCTGVYLTQVVTSHKIEHAESREARGLLSSEDSRLEHYYGNLLRTMLTLFEAIANGVSWGAVADPLEQHCSHWMLAFFIAYIFFTTFVVMNVVTGVFVSSATEKATEDRKKVLMFQLRDIFREVDDDSSGVMNWTKFEEHLRDEKVQMYLKAIDLHQEESLDLFHLLDTDDSGEIDENEFVSGCMRLHGNAKSIDLAAFMFDYKNWTRTWTEHAFLVESRLNELSRRDGFSLAAP